MSDQRMSLREQLEAAATEHGLASDEGRESRAEPLAPKGDEGQEKVPAKPVLKTDGGIPQDSLAEHKANKEKAAKLETEKAAEKPVEKAEEKLAEATEVEQKPDPKAKGDDVAPGFLSTAGKGKWANLDPILKREFKKYERDQAENGRKAHEELGKIKPEYEEFSRAFPPQLRDKFARQGMTPAQITGQLLALAQHADSDWPGFVKEQSRMRGFDIATLAAADTGQSQVDPAISALQQEVQRLSNFIQNGQQQSHQQTQAQVKSQVETFQNATSEDGSLKHPHFERLKVKMGHLMAASPDLTLEDAYRDACYADPEVRESVLADEWEKREQKRLSDLKRSEDAAKSNRGGTNGSPAGALPKGSSIRAQLISAFESAENARVN